MNPREANLQANKEVDSNCSNIPKIPSSRHRSNYKNPRIVRVSPCFGGKDRHSKVCTVKGLRDRRIRLSIPTAIQLYDLQDKLELSQPSKVVDWLLKASKCDIDELPPLPTLPVNSTHLTHQLLPSHQLEANPPSHFLNSNNPSIKDLAGSPTKEGTKVDDQSTMEKGKCNASHNHQDAYCGYTAQLSVENFFPLGNQSTLLNMPYNPYFHMDPSSLRFSPNQTLDDDHQPLNNLLTTVLPSTSQVYFCPSPAAIPSLIRPSSTSNDTRHMNHLSQNVLLPTTLNLNTATMTNFPLMTANTRKGNNGSRKSEKDNKKILGQ